MLKKIKNMMMPLILGAFLFGCSDATINYNGVPVAYAAPAASAASGASGGGGALTGGIESMPSLSMNNGSLNMGGLVNADKDKFFNTVLSEYKGIVVFISGIGTISMILFFILNFINLGKSQGNPQERQKAISGLIISGIASAGLGSVTMIVALFFNAL